MSDYDIIQPYLSEAHRAQLIEGSGISEAVLQGAGCTTIDTVKQVKALGYLAQQANTIPLPALAFPMHSVTGEELYTRLRPDKPNVYEGRERKYIQPIKHGVKIYAPPTIQPQIDNPAVPLFVTEGEKKALSAASLGMCCIALVGVNSWRGTNAKGGLTALADWNAIALNGRRVYLAFDSDWKYNPKVLLALSKLKAWLQFKQADVLIIDIPPLPDGSKCGLDDYFVNGGAQAELIAGALSFLPDAQYMQKIKYEQDKMKPDPTGLPIIETCNQVLRDVTARSMEALIKANDPPKVFVRGGRLVRVVIDEECKPSAQLLHADALRGTLDRCAEYVSTSANRGTVPVYPPAAVVANVLALPEWKELPALTGIVTAPVFAADGTLCETPGYHAGNRLYYYQESGFTLPNTTPTPSNIASALTLIRDELLGDFPFADAASEANALGLLLLPYVRFMIHGATPLHVIDAPSKGTGKGLLADACALAFVPQGLAVMTAPVKEEEWQKALFSTLLAGPSHVLIDNTRILDSANLEAVLTTANNWTARILGISENGTVPVRCTWICTANNLQVKRDLDRRIIWIRIDAKLEKPYERGNFKKPNLRAWILENRAAIVGACLTLVRAWIEAGRPAYAGSVRRGSYEAWLSIIGGILENAGIADFLANVEEAETHVDTQTEAWRGFLADWYTQKAEILEPDKAGNPRDAPQLRFGASPKELVPLAQEFFIEEFGSDPQKNYQRMGYLLAQNRDRPYGEYRLRRVKDKHKSARYCVETLE